MHLLPSTLRALSLAALISVLEVAPPVLAAPAVTLDQVLDYPYVSALVASNQGDKFAWVEDLHGVRNIWLAAASATAPRQLTHYSEDDGQELTQLTFTSNGSDLLYVRGGDHDENWPAQGNLAPNPASSPLEEKVTIWLISIADIHQVPLQIAEGDSPALSSRGQLAYVKDGQIWTAPLRHETGKVAQPHRLLFDRGKDRSPVWSPDGTRLAFVSGRDDHSFIGLYTSAEQPVRYLSPSTDFDSDPVWSPDGNALAFMRQLSRGNAPENFLVQRPDPFAFWTADLNSGRSHQVWSSPNTLAGSLPNIAGSEPLFWMANNQLVFLAETDNWPHLYAVDAAGGNARLLTPGHFMVENVVKTPDRRSLVYSANTGATAGDEARRHLFRVALDGHAPAELTSGVSIESSPAALSDGGVAYITAGAQTPAAVAALSGAGGSHVLDTGSTKDYPSQALLIPKLVTFKSSDGLTLQGELFRQAGADASQPAVIFVHGGPPRQMLLGWHYMDYYSNAYAVNQYLATHGFTVLALNYRLGIGYGRAFQHPPHAGPAGAAEYQDVLAAARYLQHIDGVDAHRIGIWGGSYGGYLTGLALARNSDIFKAGVDLHGIFNWIPDLAKEQALPEHWYEETPEWKQAVATAYAASPSADVAKWKSPVLLVHGDDDRNVPFDQTVELAQHLAQQHTPLEELIIPNEIHGFLRRSSWIRVDRDAIKFLSAHLGVGEASGK
jgi:dipeptidyl aminopeptidase/acylaminoacyl peptidase